MCLRAAEYGIRRPDSLLTAYSPFNVQYVPSPSRLISLMDPLLPTGILSACLGAYAGLGKSPFDECMKTSANSSLIAKPTSPVDINRRGSFLEKLKRGKDSRRNSDSNPSKEFENPSGSRGEGFQSCPSSPTSDSVPKGSSSNVQNGPVISGNSIHEGSSPEAEKYYSFKEENLETFIATNNDENLVRAGIEQGENIKGISFQDVKLEYDSTVSCTDGHCAHQSNIHSDSQRLLKLNMKDHTEMYVAQKMYDPLGDEYGHKEVQYTRNNEECHVVNVVDPSLSPSGETMVLSTEEPSLRIGTPPLKEDEGLEEEELTLRKGRSMSEVSLPIAKNPYMSPLVAPDEMLATLPPIDIVVRTLMT